MFLTRGGPLEEASMAKVLGERERRRDRRSVGRWKDAVKVKQAVCESRLVDSLCPKSETRHGAEYACQMEGKAMGECYVGVNQPCRKSKISRCFSLKHQLSGAEEIPVGIVEVTYERWSAQDLSPTSQHYGKQDIKPSHISFIAALKVGLS